VQSAAIMNLLCHPWFPAIRRSGRVDTIRPAQIAEADDPVMDVVWPRPDFRLATIEFLIGYLSTFAPPEDEAVWRAWWREPPGIEALDAALAPYAHAFDLDGDGPRFMQDLDPLTDSAENGVGALLIEAPGAQTERNNADLMVKRGRVARLSRSAAAIALFTLQTYAPGGGAGHRVGLRGGGPLTTLIVPDDDSGRPRPLWQLVWAHVAVGKPADLATLPKVLPWLTPTPTSEKGRTALVAGMLPLHVFWGMPRRIRLDFTANESGLPCDLTGEVDTVTVARYRTRPHGLYYDGWLPPHPLAPHYRQKKTQPWLPLHGQPAGIGYRDWIGLVVSDTQDSENRTRSPAAAVGAARTQRRRMLGEKARLFAGGYDMDNMKARGFVEAEMPLPPPLDDAAREALDECIRRAVAGANIAADLLRSAVRSALFPPSATIDAAGATMLNAVRERFWRETEGDFYQRLRRFADTVAADPDTMFGPLLFPWLAVLRDAALRCFDGAAPLEPGSYHDTPNAGQRVVRARRLLGVAFAGYSATGKRLFDALSQNLPKSSNKGGRRS
jgi:CRISPR system Cascade subunit CasA